MLLVTISTGAVITLALTFPGIGFLYKEWRKAKWEAIKRRGRLLSTIKRLEKQELVSWNENKRGEVQLTLTDKGKRKILQYKIDDLRIKKLKEWDGFWRVVTFDIPEKKRLAREVLREKLKAMGMQRLHRSVFISRFECKDEIDFLRHALEIDSCVNYILAKEISGLERKMYNK